MGKKMLGNTKSISGGGFSTKGQAATGVGKSAHPAGQKALGSVPAGTGLGGKMGRK